MTVFCPLFRAECREHECMMFRNEECLFVTFLRGVSYEDSGPEEIIESSRFEQSREIHVPDWLEEKTAEELAEDILEFQKRRYPEEEFLNMYTITDIYWEEKVEDQHNLPSEIRNKIYNANSFAQSMFRKEKERLKANRLRKEHTELPSLVGQCVDWARENELEKVSEKDVSAFIFERKLEVMPATRRLIYTKANRELNRGR